MANAARGADARVRFTLAAVEPGGQVRRVLDGCRPQYRIRSDYLTSALHRFIGATEVISGDSIEAELWLLTPEHYPGTLRVGRRIEVSEGSRVVGQASVLEVFNPVLLGDRAGGDPSWR